MRALSASNLLVAWEEGRSEPSYRRALLLLAAACPEESPEALSELSIGRRDARLLTLREWTFGRQWEGLTACPACGAPLEFSLNGADLRIGASEGTEERLRLALDGYEVEFRTLNTRDLAETAGIAGARPKQEILMERCVLAARRNHAVGANNHSPVLAVEHLPAHVWEALAARMAQAEPQADLQLALACPACDHRWQALFDIVSFFWREIHAWAVRTLREVHLLASAYGWREADILAMSPLRRGFYLEMLAG